MFKGSCFFSESVRWSIFYITYTLLGTNISPEKSILKMIFLFSRWDMLISWRVYFVYFFVFHYDIIWMVFLYEWLKLYIYMHLFSRDVIGGYPITITDHHHLILITVIPIHTYQSPSVKICHICLHGWLIFKGSTYTSLLTWVSIGFVSFHF